MLRHRPLRTGRAGHPASGSSHSSAPWCGTEQLDRKFCSSPANEVRGPHRIKRIGRSPDLDMSRNRDRHCAEEPNSAGVSISRTLPLRRRSIVHGGLVFKDLSSPRTVLVQACQHVWLVKAHDVYRKFTYVGRTHSSLAPLRLCAGRFRFASRLSVPDIRRLRCPQSFTPSCCRLCMSG